jgi:hypothetical protein
LGSLDTLSKLSVVSKPRFLQGTSKHTGGS